MKEAKDRLFKKGKDLSYENKYIKALKWLFFLLLMLLVSMLSLL